jgi:hypothetical protein
VLIAKFLCDSRGVHPHADARLDMCKYAVNLHAEDSDIHSHSTLSRSCFTFDTTQTHSAW